MKQEQMGKNDQVLLQVVNLKVYFRQSKNLFFGKYVKAVDDVTFSINVGEICGLIGESGCGKTTVGRAIVLLEQPTSGQIIFKNKDIATLRRAELKAYRRSVQMIFQDPFSALNPLWSIKQNLALPLLLHGYRNPRAVQKRCIEVLHDVKLGEEYLKKYPHELSGGEKQRICIARAIIITPELVIADEPTSMIDASLKGEICKLLYELTQQYKLSLLIISHDIDVIQSLSNKIMVMYLGKIIEKFNATEKHVHPYTQLLHYGSDFSIPDELILRFKGELPSSLTPPSGCRFHTRCPFADSRCQTEEPTLQEVIMHHFVACHKAHEFVLEQLKERPS